MVRSRLIKEGLDENDKTNFSFINDFDLAEFGLSRVHCTLLTGDAIEMQTVDGSWLQARIATRMRGSCAAVLRDMRDHEVSLHPANLGTLVRDSTVAEVQVRFPFWSMPALPWPFFA